MMKNKIVSAVVGLVLTVLCHLSTGAAADDRSTYIIRMAADQTLGTDDTRSLESSLESAAPAAKVIYKYQHVLNGYSAALTRQEAEALKAFPHVLSVFPETKYELHTTRTPQFLGLEKHAHLLPNPQQLSDVIVGVLDTGVWPESKSFDDAGLGPVPSRWRGECETGKDFSKSLCNRKLIGARFFTQGYEASLGHKIDESSESVSPRDNEGHGTHTSTTVAGSPVAGASLLGYANGTARGVAPQARVAVYKVCWKGGCYGSDILAAMDKAIEDNVNVLSLSLGGSGNDYYQDPIAIGAFAATAKGILVSCSAGNSGPDPSSLSNVAPWITTVGAGTLDRNFPAPVALGNGERYPGVSLYSGKDSLGEKLFPLVYAGNASTNDTASGNLCLPGSLNPEKVKGKIVLCERGVSPRASKSNVVKEAGGVGTILANGAGAGEELLADAHFYLATSVGEKAGSELKQYISSDPNPTATIIFQGTEVGVKPSPVVASFSSRGPNTITPEILKPDIIAPGVNILAAWTGDVGPSNIETDPRRVPYNIISGTSMSCPHVSGLAALLKAAHPKWSPAAIRSALMTTAYSTYKDGKPILDLATGKPSTPFNHGAGHVDPIAALDPGLVYDLKKSDYLKFLCALNYTSKEIKALAGKTRFACNKSKRRYSVNYLNYPSFAVSVQANSTNGKTVTVKHRRKLTNVGAAGTYKVKLYSPSQLVKISVRPWKLIFDRPNQKKSYTVTFRVNPKFPVNKSLFGRIEWRDGNNHVVGSPIAFSSKTPSV